MNICTINLLTPKNNWILISLNSIALESNVRTRRLKEIITNLGSLWLWNKFSLKVLQKMWIEQSGKYLVMVKEKNTVRLKNFLFCDTPFVKLFWSSFWGWYWVIFVYNLVRITLWSAIIFLSYRLICNNFFSVYFRYNETWGHFTCSFWFNL